jgi:predicted metal-dependent hydrolase
MPAILKNEATELRLAGRRVAVRVRVNRRARHFIVRIDPANGDVVVVAPSQRAKSSALSFARAQTRWIVEQLSQMPEPVPFLDGAVIPFRGESHLIRHEPEARRGVWRVKEEAPLPALCVSGLREHLPRRLSDWLKREARQLLTAACARYAAALELSPAPVHVRDTRSRWGSCSSSGALSFSWRLVMAPAFVLDYVAAHETAHRLHMHHRASFWAHVDTVCPRRKEADDWLDAHGNGLYRFGASKAGQDRR